MGKGWCGLEWDSFCRLRLWLNWRSYSYRYELAVEQLDGTAWGSKRIPGGGGVVNYWPRVFAASLMGSVPLIMLFLVVQRYLLGGAGSVV